MRPPAFADVLQERIRVARRQVGAEADVVDTEHLDGARDVAAILVQRDVDAANEVDLELRLKKMGLDLITSRLLRSHMPTLASGAITRQDLITFCFDLEQVSRAGIPIIEGLRDLRDGMENPRFREILTSVLEDIEGGKTLSQALAAFPRVFGTVFVITTGS